MKGTPLLAAIILVSACDLDENSGQISEKAHFASWTCDYGSAADIASALQPLADRKGLSLGIHPITSGGEGSVVRLALDEDIDPAAEVVFAVVEGSSEVIVYASKQGAPSKADRELAFESLNSSSLSGCR